MQDIDSLLTDIKYLIEDIEKNCPKACVSQLEVIKVKLNSVADRASEIKINIDNLIEQIRLMIFNKEKDESVMVTCGELMELQEAITFLANMMKETYAFLRELGKGDVNAQTPSRDNYLAGSAKDVQSMLQNLSFVAQHVTQGDYSLKIASDMGEFSENFNTMINQLKERETKLKEQNMMFKKNADFMTQMLDTMNYAIFVVRKEDYKILYENQRGREIFVLFDMDKATPLFDMVQDFDIRERHYTFEHFCNIVHKYFQIKIYPVQWMGNMAYAVTIEDITDIKNLKNHMSDIAYHDVLTGLNNRRYGEEVLKKLETMGIGFTLCFLDIDGLKYVNDTFGHEEGDIYLKFVADELKGLTRKSDVAVRMGGDEFMIIFLGAKENIIKERLIEVNKRLGETGKKYPMSVSFGMVQVPDRVKPNMGAILKEADRRMYKFKLQRKKARTV